MYKESNYDNDIRNRITQNPVFLTNTDRGKTILFSTVVVSLIILTYHFVTILTCHNLLRERVNETYIILIFSSFNCH